MGLRISAATTRRPAAVSAVAIALLASSCPPAAWGGGKEQITLVVPEPVVEARQKADEAADLLVKTLTSRLQAAFEEGGAAAAVRVCGTVAQDVTEQLGKESGVRLRRTSLKLRNPVNSPDDFERAWLERAQQAADAGRTATPSYDVVPEGKGHELRAMRPIVFPGGPCSQCHGTEEEIAPEVRALLRERYPQDRAVGFRPGDLRGAISIRVRLPPPPSGSRE